MKKVKCFANIFFLVALCICHTSCVSVRRADKSNFSKPVVPFSYRKTYYVDVDSRGGRADDNNPGTKEKPWKTISRAFSSTYPCAEPGDTILVRGGVYKEAVHIMKGGVLNKPIILKAYPGEKPIIDGEGVRKYGIKIAAKGLPDSIGVSKITVRVSHIIIDGFCLKNMDIKRGFGITVVGGNHITLQNLEVTKTNRGIYFWYSHHGKVIKCHIHHTTSNCLGTWNNCSNFIIKDNHVHHGYDNMSFMNMRDARVPTSPGKMVKITDMKINRDKTVQFSLDGVKLNTVNKWRGGLIGQNQEGTVKKSCMIVLFKTNIPIGDHTEIKGGEGYVGSGQNAFVLCNNPVWESKPFSKNGRHGLFRIGTTDPQELEKAKYAIIYHPSEAESTNIQILNNNVHDAKRQGIHVTKWNNVLIQGNKSHNNGATGIQLEVGVSNFWVANNICYNNSRLYAGETGIWVHGFSKGVVEYNVCYGNVRGIFISSGENIIVRRNVIYNNCAQYPTKEKNYGKTEVSVFAFAQTCATGFLSHGKSVCKPGFVHDSSLEVNKAAIIHNTFYHNGTDKSAEGGVCYGWAHKSGDISNHFNINNIVMNSLGRADIRFWGGQNIVSDGNIYYRKNGPVIIDWRDVGKPKNKNEIIVINNSEDFDKFKKAKGKDINSFIEEVKFKSPKKGDFTLTQGSFAIDKAQPFTHVTESGKGSIIPVKNVLFFSSGFHIPSMESVPGDRIMIAGKEVQVLKVNYKKNLIEIDQEMAYSSGDSVSYSYKGIMPDVGAFERK